MVGDGGSSAVPRRSEPAASHGSARCVDPRALCAWLGCLASHREGLIGRLVETFGGVPEILACPMEDLASVLVRSAHRDARRSCVGEQSDAGSPDSRQATSRVMSCAEQVARAGSYWAVLRQSPATCLAAQEQRGRGYSIVTWCDAHYPSALRNLADPPLCLFLRHDCSRAELATRLEAVNERPVVAVVGARAPSPYGEEMATLLGRDLTRRGALVVSGLAMGIDALAQRAAVDAARETQRPTTIAVLGCGPDVVYPKVNAALQREITRSGLAVSEFSWGIPARAWRFPARNRLIAALARAVVIVEGAHHSGARITVDFALDLGREVLAVPGEAGRRLSAAPHALLRQGAAVCESADDVFAAIAPLGPDGGPPVDDLHGSESRRPLDPDPQTNAAILSLLVDGPLDADEIARRCGLSAGAVAAALSELEVDGRLSVLAGGICRLRSG